MEDEMIELNVMKQYWNMTSSDPASTPTPNVTVNITYKPGSATQQIVKIYTDILGLLNDTNIPSSPQMVGSAAWMQYPISLIDTTKINFTLSWDSFNCPQIVNNPINCSPQGGFALVFQQESLTALGDFRANLGEGLGFEGLSGVMAIEFDTMASLHNQQPINTNMMISVQARNPTTLLLSTSPFSSIAQNTQPVNFANFNRSDFNPNVNISVGLIPNQLTQEFVLIVSINGIPQIQKSAKFSDLGIDPNRVYYVGFTGAQNLDKQSPTGTLSIRNFRLFKGKPKFVDGQVTYLYDFTDVKGNNTYLEVGSSFYDICMQKTTLIVYPTVSVNDWNSNNEANPKIMSFLYNRDTFVIGSVIMPLQKTQFYKLNSLYLTPDVKFQMSIPTGRTQAIRMGFYWGTDLIMNITSIDYFRQLSISSFAFIVIDNSDIITGTLSVKGYANNNYQFNVQCYDKSLNTSPVPLSTLQLTVTSDYIRLNDTTYSNKVSLTCYGVQAQNNLGGVVNSNTNYLFTCTFLPNVNGTYYINSPYLPSGRSFTVQIGQANQVTNILSSEYSQAIIMGDFVLNVGTTVQIYINLRDYMNNTYNLSPQDGCSFTQSYYIQNGQKYSFLFYDNYPYLSTQIITAGVADFRITISCTLMQFDLQCFRCQKIFQPLSQYFYYKLSIPAYPSKFDISLDNQTSVRLVQGSSLVVDVSFYDRYDNMIQYELSDLLFNNVNVQFLYYNRSVSRTFTFNKIQVPGKIMFSLNATNNLFFQSLPPRANTYFLNIQVPSQQSCFTINSHNIALLLYSSDKLAPIEMVGEQDQNKTDMLQSTIQWDRIVVSGRIGRIAFTLRNPNAMQMNYWPSSTITDFIDARFIDPSGKVVTGCLYQFGFGLYVGEYFGWFLCNQAPRLLYFQLLYGATPNQAIIQSATFPFLTLPSNASSVDPSFYQKNKTFVSGSGGLNIMFLAYDNSQNQINNLLIDRRQPHLGVLTYNLTKLDTGVVTRFEQLPFYNSTQIIKIAIDNVLVGNYNLQLNLPQPVSTLINFNSSSTIISQTYSYASRINSQTVQVNSQVIIKIYAFNIHNQSIVTELLGQPLLQAQIKIYVTCSAGYSYPLTYAGYLNDPGTNVYYYIFQTQPLQKNGRYQSYIYFQNIDQYLYVANGEFVVNDRFDPGSSELYLVKGVDQKEFRMIPYDQNRGIQNQYNATHYDPRLDGSMRFKMYLRTNQQGEIVSNADFTNAQFKNAYLTSAVLTSSGSFQSQLNYSGQINITIQIVNNDYLILGAATWADQTLIDQLPEGYYFIFVHGVNYFNAFTLQWMYSQFNSDLSPALIQNQINFFAPRFVNVTAGEPFTFIVAAYGNKLQSSIALSIVFNGSLTSIEIDSTQNNTTPNCIFYVTVYHNTTGIYYPQLKADTLPSREIVVQVNPAPFYLVKIENPALIASQILVIGSPVSYNFTFVDRYGNNLLQSLRDRPQLQKIDDMVQIVHSNRKPMIKFVRAISQTTYQAVFTTYYPGVVSLVVPLSNVSSTQTLQTTLTNFTFQVNQTLQIPSRETTYAVLRQTQVIAGTLVQLQLRLRDQYSQNITSLQNSTTIFSVNVIPDSVCNQTTLVMPYISQVADLMNFQVNITVACLYTVAVHYFSPLDGHKPITCINCYLSVVAAAEEYRRFDFLDSRDLLVNSFTLPAQTIYLNKYDWNPNLIMIMRDIYGNLIMPRSSADLTYTYTFEIVVPGAWGSTTVLKTGIWLQQRSFNLLTFCNETLLTTFCMMPDWTVAQLRIRQLAKATNVQVGVALINIQFVDNVGTFYNSDSISPISNNYTYVKVLNQDLMETLGQDMAVIQDQCVGGSSFPIIGRIELRTFLGFRLNDTFANLSNRLSIIINNATNYTVTFYPGSTQGQIMFTIFIIDDYFMKTESPIAMLYIDNIPFANKKIIVQCNKKQNYNKVIVSDSGSLFPAFWGMLIQAGDTLSFKMTAQVETSAATFLPYDRSVYLTNLNASTEQNSQFTAYDDTVNKCISFKFSNITKAGNLQIVGSGVSSTAIYNVTVLPGPLSAQYSYVSNEQMRVVANNLNATIYVSLADQFGNQINLTNATSDIQSFNNVSQVYYTKISHTLSSSPETWELVSQQSCFDVIKGRVRCSVTNIIEKGLYKWRVVIKGVIAKCLNCYFRVVPTGNVKLDYSIVTDLSQNYYLNQQFAMAGFNQVQRRNYFYMKVFLTDEKSNVYIHEDLPTVPLIWPMLSNSTVNTNLTFIRLGNGKALNALVYKITVNSSQAAITSFSNTLENQYSLRLISNTMSPASFPLYIKQSLKSPGFVAPQGSVSKFQTKEKQKQTAGKFTLVQFGIFNSGFLNIPSSYDLNKVTFSIPIPSSSDILQNGLQVVAKYRGLYEMYQRFTNFTFRQQSYQQKFVISINGFDPAIQPQLFETTVFPGPMTQIQYSPDGTLFNVQDQYGNGVDFLQDSQFSMQVIQTRLGLLPPQILLQDVKIISNMTLMSGVIVLGNLQNQNISKLVVVQSLFTYQQAAFVGYQSQNQIDYDKSSFSYSKYNIIAGSIITVRVILLDPMYQPLAVNLTGNVLSNLTVRLVSFNTLDPAQYGRIIVRNLNFQQCTIDPTGLLLNIQVNQSAYYFIEVRYYGVILPHTNSKQSSQWFFVDIKYLTGVATNQQWAISMTAVQKNQVSSPISTQSGLQHVSFMKGQPIFFVSRLCDMYGNIFYSPVVQSLYNTGDVALQASVNNYGDTRQLVLNTQFVWNFMTLSANQPLNRAVYQQFVPSFYPLVNNQYYDSQKSYIINLYTNSSANINLKELFLIITSDSAIDIYHSVNVSTSQDMNLAGGGIQCSDFDAGIQIKIRLQIKNLLVVSLRNTDNRPYLSEQIMNFTIALTNTTLQNVTISGKNTTVVVPVNTVSITILQYSNSAFYRVLLNASQLYQDPVPLNALVSVTTKFKYNAVPQQINVPLWVFPQTPPNFLNKIVNTTYLSKNQTYFQPANKITFLLTLMYNGQIYMNDLQSALRIIVYRGSTVEYVTAQLLNKTTYSVSVNLEGPQANQFRIYYQDTNNALYPLISPDVLDFEIQSADTMLSPLSQPNSFESFYYEKLGHQELMQPIIKQIQKFNPALIRLILIPNMIQNADNSLTYYIGNELRIQILIVNTLTSRCLLQGDYIPYQDVNVLVQRYDPVTKTVSSISIDVQSINLVQKVVIQPASYCTFYSVAVLESQDQLSIKGNYSLTATFLPSLISTSIVFQAVTGGIDFTLTTIGWYQGNPNTNTQNLIAEINAYDEFNYLIYFMDVQGNFVSDRQQQVTINIKFDQEMLTVDKDFTYISRYDDRFKGYLITLSIMKSGSYQPEYYFNQQSASNMQVLDGPVLFMVREPKCMGVEILSITGSSPGLPNLNPGSLMIGQLYSFVFHCFDVNSKEITQNIQGLLATAIFQSDSGTNVFVPIESLQNGIYRIQNKFYMEGLYTIKIYFNGLLIFASSTSQSISVVSELCKDLTPGSQNRLLFKCPLTPWICANSYQECPYVNAVQCPNLQAPFLCGVGSNSGSNLCVSNMNVECCKTGVSVLPNFQWCPQTNQCINTTVTSCPSILSSTTPLWCQSKLKYVENQTQCCADITYIVTRVVGLNTTIVVKSMVKCSSEDKCVHENTAKYCFYSFIRNCFEIFGSQFTYQCPNDGRCRRSADECPTPRVCPPGYTQCADYTCIIGINQHNKCNKLQNCTTTLPDGSIIEYIRCPDGSCSRTYEDCPTQVSCMSPGQVVCPDGSCQNSQYQCIQPNQCTSERPYACPGFPSTCAASRNNCPLPSSKSCGGTMSLCANGDCSSSCLSSGLYFVLSSQSKKNSVLSLQSSCFSQGLVQCPNFECRSSYFDCSDTLFCPVPLNYTYSPSAIICPGVQICALDRQDCSYSQCESSLNTQFLPSNNAYDSITINEMSLETCYDGRCHIQGRQKQQVCMTPISCSSNFIKTGGFGEHCVSTTNISTSIMELSILLNDQKCPSSKQKCVTGECRNSIDDCPTQITCPQNLPIQCRDGTCVMSKIMCEQADISIQINLFQCQAIGMLLCTSDLITCTTSLSKCPTRSSCPIGYIKCWDESCKNPEAQENCPGIQNKMISQQISLTTCPDLFSVPNHCFADGSCRESLQDCPSISYCPQDRPVKCAADNSCRKSIQTCPAITQCLNGYKFCAGEGTCIQQSKPCGTPVTCSASQPFLCEDGFCVSSLKLCSKISHSLSQIANECIEQSTNYLCMNNRTQCTQNLFECTSSSSCQGSKLVKGQSQQLCYNSRQDYSGQFDLMSENQQCYLSNQYRCSSDGKCQEMPCKEWLNCRDSSMIRCWDGQCVQNLSYCTIQQSGCPAYIPFRCNQSTLCVTNMTICPSQITSTVTSVCMSQFNLPITCQFDGSCAGLLSDCPTSQPQCQKQGGKHNICLNQVCPEQVPYKCTNGLCVTSKSNCPLSPFSLDEIQYCQIISQQTGMDLYVPCGNGICKESAEQCQPLFECTMNLNSKNFIRCSDGTCRELLSQCPQYVSSTLTQICPIHIPFLCSNGMCSKNEMECIKNENGCPQAMPFKCDQTGQCLTSMSACQNPLSQLAQMFIYPNYIPAISPTPLIAVYGLTRSICQALGQFTCRIGNGLPYCVDRLDSCIQFDNQCPVNNPIRCGIKCLTSYFDCQNDNCTSTGGLQRCPSLSMTGTQCTDSVNNFTNCVTSMGCPLENQSFKCPSQLNMQVQCSALPYSSNPTMSASACTTFQNQLTTSFTQNNQCIDQESPYSCADGSCVADVGQCQTCIFYCASLRRCVRSQSDCHLVLTSTSLVKLIQQECPLSVPFRCILSGKCVKREIQCSKDSLISVRMSFKQTFYGTLLSEKCPFLTPIKCQDGKCVRLYDDCINHQRIVQKAQNTANFNPFMNPILWGQLSSGTSPCQVVCFDGSCRDRVENCPFITGCYDPQRPYRCMSGFCGKNYHHCVEMFQLIETSGSSCNVVTTPGTYTRCEDGTCRPIIQVTNSTTNITKNITSCLPFMGCPVNRPFHCSTGECSDNIESCAGLSQCTIDTPFRCKNYKCVKHIIECNRPFSTISSLQIDRTFDPLEESWVNFAYDENDFVIAKLLIPSNAIKFNAAMSQVQSLQRIQTYPVPDSILENVVNQIPQSRVSYIQRIYSLNANRQLSRGLSLLSPVVKIESIPTSSGELQQGMTSITIQRQLSIFFKFDTNSFPMMLDMMQDICLAKVYDVQNILIVQQDATQQQSSWQCEQRVFNLTDDGFLMFKISSLGIYAVIINPNPDVVNTSVIQCGFLCQNQLTILILAASGILLFMVAIYAVSMCCQTSALSKSRVLADNKRMALLMASQSDSFYAGQDSSRGRGLPPFITQEVFYEPSGNMADLDINRVKEVLEGVDQVDPPLMPGRVVMHLTHHSEVQSKQIEELKCQLQEQNEREKENLKLIKRIFHQKQLVYEQMQNQSEIKSQSRKDRSIRSRKKKEAINDPSIKKDYEDIEEYLAKILSDTHLPDMMDPKASQATFQNYPGVNKLRIHHTNPADQSLQSIQADHLFDGKQRDNIFKSDSMQQIIAGQKNAQSTSNLEIYNQNSLKRKAADMMMKNINDQDKIEEFKYDERAEEAAASKLRRKVNENNISEQEGSPGDREINKKYGGGAAYNWNEDQAHQNDDVTTTGIDSGTLSKTLNQLFAKARKPGSSAGYNMLMGSGAVSGTVSGNLVKRSQIESALAAKFQKDLAINSTPPSNRNRPVGANGAFDDESEESDENLEFFEDYEQTRQVNNNNSGIKSKSNSPELKYKKSPSNK